MNQQRENGSHQGNYGWEAGSYQGTQGGYQGQSDYQGRGGYQNQGGYQSRSGYPGQDGYGSYSSQDGYSGYEEEPQRPERRRRRPAGAGSGQKMVILALSIAVTFLLGILAGLGLAYNSWVTEGTLQEPESPGLIRVPENVPGTLPEDTEPATEATREPAPEATTEPATEATTAPMAEPTGEQSSAAVSAETRPAANTSEYILPDSDRVYLSPADYQGLSDWELILARNEIYARHGRLFNDPDIQAYFNGCSWYHGSIAPDDFSADVFNEVELQNIKVLKAASDAR